MNTANASLPPTHSLDMDQHCLDRMAHHESEQHFNHLFDKYYTHLCQLSYSKLRCEHKSQEVVSDVFMKLWQKRQELQVKGKVISYLRRAVINQTIDYLRDGTRHRNFGNPLVEGLDVAEESGLNQLYAKELSARIESIVSALPPQGQKIFRMSRDEGMTYRQIADTLGISSRTVETHLRRSLAKIKEELNL